MKYTNIQKPVLDIEEAIELGSLHKDKPPEIELETKMGDAETVYSTSQHKITGDVPLGSQYHFYMENHVRYFQFGDKLKCLNLHITDGLM